MASHPPVRRRDLSAAEAMDVLQALVEGHRPREGQVRSSRRGGFSLPQRSPICWQEVGAEVTGRVGDESSSVSALPLWPVSCASGLDGGASGQS